METSPPYLRLLAMLLVANLTHRVYGQSEGNYQEARQRMVQEALVAAGVKDPRVLRSAAATPRHEFVDRKYRRYAYFDMALPIGDRQTISSPFIVAYMTESIDPQPTDRVLEIGTGSGYQAAILSPLVKSVYSIEIVPALGRNAKRVLQQLNYQNVHTRIGDGFKGWTEHAPFDKIIVTCSPEDIPKPLVTQLKEGGLMVIPVGERFQQTLYLMRKQNGKLVSEALRPTLFVPMTGQAEKDRQVQPDPLRPEAVNGNFEKPPQENKFLPGWYYQRQMTWETDDEAPQGQHYIKFTNRTAGLAAHIIQGFPIQGSKISQLKVSGWFQADNVASGRSVNEFAGLTISFYDKNRQPLTMVWIGPVQGTKPWHRLNKTFRVPASANEGILRVGLFGGTGTMAVDNVQMSPVAR